MYAQALLMREMEALRSMGGLLVRVCVTQELHSFLCGFCISPLSTCTCMQQPQGHAETAAGSVAACLGATASI